MLRKHGEGSVIKDEDVKKTASTESDSDREQRLSALDQENQDTDR